MVNDFPERSKEKERESIGRESDQVLISNKGIITAVMGERNNNPVNAAFYLQGKTVETQEAYELCSTPIT